MTALQSRVPQFLTVSLLPTTIAQLMNFSQVMTKIIYLCHLMRPGHHPLKEKIQMRILILMTMGLWGKRCHLNTEFCISFKKVDSD